MNIRNKIINILKHNPQLLSVAAFCYSVVHGTSPKLLMNKKINCRGAFLSHVKFRVSGSACINIAPKTRLSRCLIIAEGENVSIRLGGGNLIGTVLTATVKDAHIKIGKGFSSEGARIQTYNGADISIGEDCMLSSGIEITAGDFHTIRDRESGTVLNGPRDITIGSHVWLCRDAKVMKGAVVPGGCVIGHSGIVTGKLSDANAVYVGIPARKVRENIEWEREI